MGYRGRGFWRKHLNKDQDIDLSESSHGAFVRTHRGDDTIVGSNYSDWILSGSGDDTVEGGAGNDVMFGGRGQDTGVFSGSLLDYQVYGCGPWTFVVGQDGCDFLHRFEILQFDDFTLNLRANNGPLAALRSDDLETSEDDGFSFQVDVYDMDGDSVSVATASVTGGGNVTVSQGAASQVSAMGTSSGLEVSFDPGSAYASLAEGESATETVTLVLSDGRGGTTTVTYDITIEGENDGPIAVAVSESIAEDGPETSIFANFTDVDASDSHTFSVDTTGTQGTVTDNGDGTFGYDPAAAFESLAAGETATDSFTYTVDDGNGGTATETVTITINGSNDGPVAAAVVDSASEDGPGITIAANFTDVDASDSHTFSVDTTGTLGSVTDNGDGTFGYDPAGAFESLAAGETATDSFTYTVDDGNGGTATETVTITINGSNDGPIVSAASDVSGMVRAAINFGDDLSAAEMLTLFDGAAGTASLVTLNGQDALRVGPQGVNRVPHTEIDLFSAGALASDDVVIVNITSFNTRTGGDQDVLIGLTDGDRHISVFTIDGGGVGFFSDSVFASGEYGVGFPETPPLNDRTFISLANNIDNFSVRVVIDSANDQISLLAGGPGTTNVIGTATLSGDAGEWLDPSQGLSLTVSNDNPGETFYYNSLEYDVTVAARSASGQVVFDDVDVTDTHVASVSNVALSGTVGALVGSDVQNLLNLSVTSTDTASAGTVDWSFATPGSLFDYLANGETLDVTYTVTIDDGNGGTADQIVTITVHGTNSAPVAAAVSDSADEDGPGITISADYSDVDASDSHTFSIDTTGTLGAVTNNGDGTFGYNPAGGFESLAVGETATDSFAYTVDDGNGGTATETVTITINGSNDGPVAAAVVDSVSEDGPGITIAADFTDVDASDSHTFSVDTTDTLGSVTDNGDGTFGYDPAGAFDSLGAGETATDTFTYTVDDGNGGTATETVTITINGSNDGPVALPVTAVSEEDSQVVIGDSVGSQIVPNMGYHYVFNFDTGVATAIPRDGGANKTPQQIADQYLPDGNGMVFGANPNNSGWGASAVTFVDGVETTIPPTDFVVTDSDGGSIDTTNPGWIAFGDDNKNVDEISITVTDLAMSNGTTVDVNVTAGPFDYEVNGATDNVLVQGVSFEATVNTPSPEVTITADVSDVDGDTFVFSVDTIGTLGSVVDNGDGTFDYSADGVFEHLDDGETATDTFTYTVTDDQGATDTETVTIVINGADDLLFA